MVRPCFLVIDQEHAASISTRKLVIETAKMNVITAYSSAEAMETLRRFPGVDGAVLDDSMRDMPCAELVDQLRSVTPGLRIVIVGEHCAEAVRQVDRFDPGALLRALKELEPEKAKKIQEHDRALAEREQVDRH